MWEHRGDKARLGDAASALLTQATQACNTVLATPETVTSSTQYEAGTSLWHCGSARCMTDDQPKDITVETPSSVPSDRIGEPVLRTYSRKHRPSQQDSKGHYAHSPNSVSDSKSISLASVSTRRFLQQKNSPKLKKRSFTQLHLDAGQADFACTTCSTCGLIYAIGEANDEKVHAAFHAKFTVGIKFQGWQHERIVKWDVRQGRVLLVLQSDPATHLRKVREVCSLVEDHLGLCKGWLMSTLCQVYMYISSSKHVLGCLVAEQITSASPVVPSPDGCMTSSATSSDPLQEDPPVTPSLGEGGLSATPFAKHKPLSSLLNTHISSSTMLASQTAFGGCCTGPQLNTLEQPASQCHAQQHISVGSSQSTLVASPGLLSSQPARKQPKQNLLTKWLATSQHKAAAARSLQPDSPLSAGSVAASRQEEKGCYIAVDSKLAQSAVGQPIPVAPLADVTNKLPASIASESSSMTQEALGTKDLHSSVREDAAATAVLAEQHHQQQQAEADFHSMTQQTGQKQCQPLQAGKDPADSQQLSACTHFLLGGCNDKHTEAGLGIVSADAQTGQGRALAADGQQRMLKRLQRAVVRVDRATTVKAACGIKVMWVSAQARRRGIATLLLDSARFAFVFSPPYCKEHVDSFLRLAPYV